MQNYSVVSTIKAITAADKATAAIIEKRRAAFDAAQKAAAKRAASHRAIKNSFFAFLAFCMMVIFFFSLWAVCCYDYEHYTYSQKVIMIPTFYFTAVLSPVMAALLYSNIED